MASIKGWHVKNVNQFRGRDWMGVECDIYLDGKKVGFYFDEGNGGEVNLELINQEIEARANEDAKTYFSEHPMIGLCADLPPTVDLFIAEVIALEDLEKEHKKMSKMNFPYMLVYKESEDDFDDQVKGFNLKAARQRFIDKNTIYAVRCYDKPEDFIIK